MVTLGRDHPEVVTIGETMALLLPPFAKGIESSSQMEVTFAGAESNVAIALARLGHRAGWISRLGDDPPGRMIVKRLRGEEVDVSQVETTPLAPTGLMMREETMGITSVYYYRSASAASLMKPDQLSEAYVAGAKILHITGITPALSASCRETIIHAVDMARRNGVKVCFDPNLRLKLWSLEEARNVLIPLAEQADYFLPGLPELELLYGTKDIGVIKDKVKELSAVCVVKGGPNSTYLVEGGEWKEVPHVSVETVVDPIGAGDAFCAGFLAGMLRGFLHLEAVRLGNLLGSLAVRTRGDWEGLPTWPVVERLLNDLPHIER